MAQGSQDAGNPKVTPGAITIDPEVRFGKPCIHGHRITVQKL
jgi:uncharacterized protein (DUF433 family)